MNLLIKTRTEIIEQLWQRYLNRLPKTQKIIAQLQELQQPIVLDHFALIDLPSSHSGIHTLTQIFTALGYGTRGHGYLPEKQNDFSWLAPTDANNQTATNVLPQIVVADFRYEQLSHDAQKILDKYTASIKPFDFAAFYQLLSQLHKNDFSAEEPLVNLVVNYCDEKDWPALTLAEFNEVKKSNELMAWVLAFGRRINHFGLSIHHMPKFESLEQWNNSIQLNDTIKGDATRGIAQSASRGELEDVHFADGHITMHGPFVEFVWRYPNKTNPQYWQDYFTDFIDYQANRVIESVYE